MSKGPQCVPAAPSQSRIFAPICVVPRCHGVCYVVRMKCVCDSFAWTGFGPAWGSECDWAELEACPASAINFNPPFRSLSPSAESIIVEFSVETCATCQFSRSGGSFPSDNEGVQPHACQKAVVCQTRNYPEGSGAPLLPSVPTWAKLPSCALAGDCAHLGSSSQARAHC